MRMQFHASCFNFFCTFCCEAIASEPPPPGGGGGRGYSPQMIGRYMSCSRGKVKNGQGLRNASRSNRAWKCGASERAWVVLSLKMRGSGTSLSHLWAWKCGAPERPLTRGAAERAEPRPWEAMNRLKLKKFSKWWSPERQNPPKYVKWWCSGTDFFGNLWKWYAPERKFMAENGGLVCGTYPICIHMEVPPPPPRESRTLWAQAYTKIAASTVCPKKNYNRTFCINNGQKS